MLKKDFSLIFNRKLNSFDPCNLLGQSQYQPNFEQQYLENGKRKGYHHLHFFEKILGKFSEYTQVDRLSTCDSLVTYVQS